MSDMMRQKTERTGHIKTVKLDLHCNKIIKEAHFMCFFSKKWARMKERSGFWEFAREIDSEKVSWIQSPNGLFFCALVVKNVWPKINLIQFLFDIFTSVVKWRASITRVFVDSPSSRKIRQFLAFSHFAISRMRNCELSSCSLTSRCSSFFVRQWFS